MHGLEDNTVNVDITIDQLLVDVAVNILGDVDSDVECHARESFLEGCFQGILLVRLVTTVPEGDYTAFGECSLVDVIQGTSLDFRGCMELQKSVVSGHGRSQKAGRGDNLGQNHIENKR